MKKVIAFMLLAILSAVFIFTAFTGNIKTEAARNAPNDLHAKGIIVMDRNTGKTIWGKNAETRMYPASTTKIMTALLAIEYGNARDVITVGSEINLSASDASKAGLVKGQRISLENLLKGLLLPSGSDAAYALAVYTARKASKNPSLSGRAAVEYFCRLMNKRAVKAGAENTHFVNPDGYHSKYHYSTAYDLALIAKAAMRYRLFRSVVSTQSFSIRGWKATSGRASANGNIIRWQNTNKLINKKSSYYYKYVTGIKTGFTDEAGHCLVSSATKGWKNIIVVVLDSTTDGIWTDSTKLLDYGLGL